MSRLVVLTISVFVGLVVPILCKRGIETFSAGSFVLGGFCISTILAALGFAVVHADKKHEEEQNEEEVGKKSTKAMFNMDNMKSINWRHEEIIAEAISNLEKGKSVAIIGRMGSGKSLLFTELMSSMPYGLYPKIICIDEVSTEDEREFVLQHLKDKQSAVIFTQHSEDEISLVRFYGDYIYKNLMIIKCAVDANGKRTASLVIA